MNIGVSTASFYPDSLTEEALIRMGNMGIKTSEIFLESYSEYGIDFCNMLNERLKRYDINAYSVHALGTQFEPQLFSSTYRQRNDALKIFKKVLKAAQILGAKVYVFHGPPVRKNVQPELDFVRIGQITDEISEISADYGIKFAWENVYWCWYSYPEFATRLLDNSKGGNIYFTLDIKQSMKSGWEPLEFLSIMRYNLANVHVCDYNSNGQLFLPGRGQYNFEGLYKQLQGINYKGPIILEVYRNNYSHYTEIMEGVDHLRSIFDS